MNRDANHTPSENRTGTIHVRTNMNCALSLDGKETGLTDNATFTFRDVPYGRHILEGSTDRHFAGKEIFLNLPELNIRLVLEERGGVLTVESEMEGCRIELEGTNYNCPVNIPDLKRGIIRIRVSGENFHFTDKVRIQNNQTTSYRVTKALVREKQLEMARQEYERILKLPETTLKERKDKVKALDEILVTEQRFDLKAGIEIHRRLVQAIRREEFARETMSQSIRIEKNRKKRKYSLILSVTAIVFILALAAVFFITRSNRIQKDENCYLNAVQSGSPAKYTAYLKSFGKNARHFKEARNFLDQSEKERQAFNRAILINTIAAFENYLKNFGQNAAHRAKALTALKKLRTKQNFPELVKKLELAVLPGGSYSMGASPAEKTGTGDNLPTVWVKINPFAIGRHEVTFNEYGLFCKETGLPLPKDAGFGRGNRPVINVSWENALAYCKWLSQKTGLIVRLPSEAEWEYACRASRMSVFFWGNEMDHQYCISGQKRRGRTRPVKSTKPNNFGLYDMSGNVYEWCSDRYQDPVFPGKNKKYRGSSYRFFQKYEKNESKNPVFRAWGDRRIIRGGSYRSSDFACRSSHRAGTLPTTKRNDIGFRIAVSIPK
ncbi:MAG: formylglycine-generating enzyme family protein [Acidobacteria bacterium]|nr:formylglycine-generating enzyme family protein [Acidobacteriota bacterium]